MLDAINLLSIVNSGEGYNAEFKVNIPTNMKNITEEVCAFANASGGVVLIGVDDKNNIKGVTLDNTKRSALQKSLKEISPALQCDFYMVEQIGSGINRMIDLMQTEKLTPPEFSTDGIFTVTLRRPFDFDKWVNKLTAKQIVILKAIHENPKIKKVKPQELATLSGTAVDNNIEILKVEGLLERVGTKGGVWILHYILPEVGK